MQHKVEPVPIDDARRLTGTRPDRSTVLGRRAVLPGQAGGLAFLQRTAGNAAVAGMLSRRQARMVQRCGDHVSPGCPCAEEREQQPTSAGASAGVQRLPDRSPVLTAQRYSLDGFRRDVSGLGASAVGLAEDTFGTVASSAAFRDAVTAAQRLVGIGGSVSMSGTRLVIDIPEISLLDAVQTPLADLPSAGLRLPLLAAGAELGPVLLEADVGAQVTLRPEVLAVLGPAMVRGIRIVLDPAVGSYMGTGQLHISGSESLVLSVEPGLDAQVAAVVMVGEVPVPIEADVFGGVRLALRGTGLGSLDETVSLGYRGGGLFLDALTDLRLGVRLDAELDATVEIAVFGEPVCEYTWPLKQWPLAENAEQYTLPVSLRYGPGGPGYSVGPVTAKPIPVGDIEAVVPTMPMTRDCAVLDRLVAVLCAKGVLPADLCHIRGHGGGPLFVGPGGGRAPGGGGGGSVTPAAPSCSGLPTPSGTFVVNKPGHPLHGATVTYGDPRNKHTRNATCTAVLLESVAGDDPAKYKGALKRWVAASRASDKSYGSQIGSEGYGSYETFVRRAIEDGTEKSGKYFLDVGTKYGVDVIRPWPLVSKVRVDGAPHGAHIVPET